MKKKGILEQEIRLKREMIMLLTASSGFEPMNWKIWLSRFDLSAEAWRSRRLCLVLVIILL